MTALAAEKGYPGRERPVTLVTSTDGEVSCPACRGKFARSTDARPGEPCPAGCVRMSLTDVLAEEIVAVVARWAGDDPARLDLAVEILDRSKYLGEVRQMHETERDPSGAIVRGPSLACGCPLDSGCDFRSHILKMAGR